MQDWIQPEVQVEQHPFWKSFDRETEMRLLRVGSNVSFRPGRTLVREGRPLEVYYLLLSGVARFTTTDSSDREAFESLCAAPATVGDAELLSPAGLFTRVKSVTQVKLFAIPAAELHLAIQANPSLVLSFVQRTTRRLHEMQDSRLSLQCDALKNRLAKLLIRYAELAGSPSGNFIRLQCALTQQQLASDLGVTRKSVAEALSNFRRAGLIGKSKGRYELARPTRIHDAFLTSRVSAGDDESSRDAEGSSTPRPTDSTSELDEGFRYSSDEIRAPRMSPS
jgi:CRP/FNR family transcriptional regulator